MTTGSKEALQLSEKMGNHDQRTKILSGQLITAAILAGDLPLYQRAGLDTGYKVLSIAEAGQTYLSGRRRYVTEPGKNGVPHLKIRVDIDTQQVPNDRIAVSIEKPRDRIGFKSYDRRLKFLREQRKNQV